jgi:hypothetical protein
MREELRAWWTIQEAKMAKPLKKPTDLLNRLLTDSEYVDTAVIGGVELKDIIAGKLAESRIAPDVVHAFHEQYPNIKEGFVATVHRLSGNPEQLRGLVSGVKGKLFEDQYVSWLDHGHLPAGYHAELAHHANNPIWDILIKDSHGHVDNLLQLKATESAAYVRQALDAHPNIDLVTTHEIFNRLSDHHADLAHLIDSGISNGALTDHAASAVEHADAASHLAFHLPLLAVSVAVVMEFQRYRTGRQSMGQAVQQMGKRSLMALIATTVRWVVTGATGKTIIGLPAAVLARMAAGSLASRLESRATLAQGIEQVRQSSARLAAI